MTKLFRLNLCLMRYRSQLLHPSLESTDIFRMQYFSLTIQFSTLELRFFNSSFILSKKRSDKNLFLCHHIQVAPQVVYVLTNLVPIFYFIIFIVQTPSWQQIISWCYMISVVSIIIITWNQEPNTIISFTCKAIIIAVV